MIIVKSVVSYMTRDFILASCYGLTAYYLINVHYICDLHTFSQSTKDSVHHYVPTSATVQSVSHALIYVAVNILITTTPGGFYLYSFEN